ncbi:MAG: peptidoglycan DD-metalloendopeptidase family protein [Candidatus Cloacimonetes bacterium]|nr:peptidoglycan DD-metalloendopeptidase family protein [Candidatus Cloacimonadota bacterium]
MKKILIFSFLLLFAVSFSQDLDEKKKQLDALSEQISKQEEMILETEKKQDKTEKEISSKLNKKKETEQKVIKLQKSENNIKDQLNSTKSGLITTQSKLQLFRDLCNQEFKKLCEVHYENLIYNKDNNDPELLTSLILNTSSEIDSYSSEKTDLEKKQAKEQREFENVQWSRIVAKKKSKKYINEIENLETDLVQLEELKLRAVQQKEKMEKEAAALDELITKLRTDVISKDYSYQFSTSKLIWPLRGEIIRDFGVQKSDVYNVSITNNGIDIRAEEGTEVVAIEDGIIVFAEWHGGSGKLVIIDHTNGFYSLYAHNNSLLVSKGDKVEKNQPIALSGKTGNVKLSCLHFELRKRGNPVDPMDYLE